MCFSCYFSNSFLPSFFCPSLFFIFYTSNHFYLIFIFVQKHYYCASSTAIIISLFKVKQNICFILLCFYIANKRKAKKTHFQSLRRIFLSFLYFMCYYWYFHLYFIILFLHLHCFLYPYFWIYPHVLTKLKQLYVFEYHCANKHNRSYFKYYYIHKMHHLPPSIFFYEDTVDVSFRPHLTLQSEQTFSCHQCHASCKMLA